MRYAQGHLRILELPEPCCAAKVISEAPGGNAATAAQQASPGSQPQQARPCKDESVMIKTGMPTWCSSYVVNLCFAAHVLIVLQTKSRNRVALTSADWLCTCKQEWDHAASAYLGSITIGPRSKW